MPELLGISICFFPFRFRQLSSLLGEQGLGLDFGQHGLNLLGILADQTLRLVDDIG